MIYVRSITITRRTSTMTNVNLGDFAQPDRRELEIDADRRIGGVLEQPPATPAGLGAQTFERALATTIEPPPTHTSGLRCVRAESFRQDNDGDVMVKPFGMALEVAIDDPLALLAVTMAAIKFGHPPDVLAAAQKLVSDFGKEPTR